MDSGSANHPRAEDLSSRQTICDKINEKYAKKLFINLHKKTVRGDPESDRVLKKSPERGAAESHNFSQKVEKKIKDSILQKKMAKTEKASSKAGKNPSQSIKAQKPTLLNSSQNSLNGS